MARLSNNELSALPGFFYYPRDVAGLEELTFEQRGEIRTNQGHYMMPTWMCDPAMRADVICDFDNARIPTHRRPGTVIPTYGHVPFDLREIIEL